MNDRAAGVLERYDIEVLRTWKGRGALLCESDKGILILKEYAGPEEKLAFQDLFLNLLSGQGFCRAETILRTREGELLCRDQDNTAYILKAYAEGRECNIRDMGECVEAVGTLARLHKASAAAGPELLERQPEFCVEREYEKHNKELRKVRKFLKGKSQKSDFEIFLNRHFDYFFNLALQVTEEMRYCLRNMEKNESSGVIVCHGDYQYHNIIRSGGETMVVNFEKCVVDHPVRDLYLFMRKLLEKSNWSAETGDLLLSAYDKENALAPGDHLQLYYRLAYPEKFWKIVNFYYNSGKAWIPGRNMEKLQKLLLQEKQKEEFLQRYKKISERFPF